MTNQSNEAARADNTATPAFSTAYRNYALVLLLASYTMNVVDRNIVNIILEPLKQELHLSDTQLGFLTGLSFAVMYSTLGIPIAMLADRRNRRNIIATCLAIFSVATAVCGFAANFGQLLLARVVVAIGEAGTTPSSQSIIADMFPRNKRAGAMGFYFLGINLGTLIGFLMGGWIAQWYGWRAAFMIVGLPGLFIAILMWFTLREPKRGQADEISDASKLQAPRLGEVLKFLAGQRSFLFLLLGITIMSCGTYSITVWWPSFMIRSFGMGIGEVGTIFALTLGVIGGAGTFLTGLFADKMGRRDVRWNFWNMAILHTIMFPFCAAMYLSTNQWVAVVLFVVPAFIYSSYSGGTAAMIQAIAPVRMRAQTSAIYFLLISLIGGSLGPQISGIVSDHLHPIYGQDSLRYALLVMTAFWPLSVIPILLASRYIKRDMERARAADGQ